MLRYCVESTLHIIILSLEINLWFRNYPICYINAEIDSYSCWESALSQELVNDGNSSTIYVLLYLEGRTKINIMNHKGQI